MAAIALFITVLAVGALAQSGTPASTASTSTSSTVAAETTATLFIGPGADGDGFAGFVVDADSCATTYGLVCTSGTFGTQAEAYCDHSETVCDPAAHNKKV